MLKHDLVTVAIRCPKLSELRDGACRQHSSNIQQQCASCLGGVRWTGSASQLRTGQQVASRMYDTLLCGYIMLCLFQTHPDDRNRCNTKYRTGTIKQSNRANYHQYRLWLFYHVCYSLLISFCPACSAPLKAFTLM
jgi:hypothetical protein